jgi:hypothetical protein
MISKAIVSLWLISLMIFTAHEPALAGRKHNRSDFRRAKAELKRKSLTDDKLPKNVRGWLKNQQRQRGNNPRNWRNPPGYDAGHALLKPTDLSKLSWETSNMNRSRGAKRKR